MSETPRPQPPAGDTLRPAKKDLLLWGLLVVVVLGLLLTTLWRSVGPIGTEPPPVLGQVPDFELINRDGRQIDRADLLGDPWVADFVFTRCVAICPRMTQQMKDLGPRLPARSGVRRVSISVDPLNDTPEVLTAYARRYDAPSDWLFLTGDRQEIYELCRDGFKLAVGEAPNADAVDPIFHSNRFVLVDGRGQIRGYYDAFDAAEIERLVQDLRGL